MKQPSSQTSSSLTHEQWNNLTPKQLFQTAALETLKEMLGTPTYIPTITMTDSEEAGGEFVVKFSVTHSNAHPTLSNRWPGAFLEKSSATPVVVKFIGSITSSASIEEILPGYDETVI